MSDFRKYFTKTIQNNYPDKFSQIISRTDANYKVISKDTSFALTSKNPLDKRLVGYGIDIIECGICKLFKKHNFDKYASILCEVDEITSGLAGLKLIRTGTIANGAKKCDFRFQRLTHKSNDITTQ